MQKVIQSGNCINDLSAILQKIGSRKILIVCDNAYKFLPIKNAINNLSIPHIIFSDFCSNPQYDSVCNGVKILRENQCDTIVAVGGGSAIDVAKCIKLYSNMNGDENYLEQRPSDNNDITLIAIPTTAGTGSESTRYAVIYYECKKQSIMHNTIVPNYAILDFSLLKSLPEYQKKCTMLDALCQAIESWWSVNSNADSISLSQKAIHGIIANYHDYIFANTLESAQAIIIAANYAGQAINITQTTAAHAMSYKLTSMFNIPHGHAVAICLPKIWRYMLEVVSTATVNSDNEKLSTVFLDISNSLGYQTCNDAIDYFESLLIELSIKAPANATKSEIDILAQSVNPTRLKNNPIALTEPTLRTLYQQILLK